MLVYACNFDLRLDVSLKDAELVVTDWISRKAKVDLPDNLLSASGHVRLQSLDVAVVEATDGYPKQKSIRVAHGDNRVRGRQWVTEIGLLQARAESNVKCSVQLGTNEISTRVLTTVEMTRPIVVRQLIEKYGHPALCPGSQGALTLDEMKVADFYQYLHDPDRKHPIILVSARQADGQYYVSPSELCSQTLGLANVYVVPPDANTYAITEVLTRRCSAWNGAINILFPITFRYDESFVPSHLLLSDELDALAIDGVRLEQDVLSRICHRTNFPNAKLHLSPDKVLTTALQRRLDLARKEIAGSGDYKQYFEISEEINRSLQHEVSALAAHNEQVQEENQYLLLELSYKEEMINKLQYDKATLETNMLQISMALPQAKALDPQELTLVYQGITAKPTPEHSLRLIASLFPDRVLVLESAYESAADSERFLYREAAFDLLWRLATCYWEALTNGQGDTTARQCFGNAYAAKESETVEKTESARRRRTFRLPDGRQMTMCKHLKHGVKDSPAETIRIHFEWLPELGKVVIGYCGPHLDFD